MAYSFISISFLKIIIIFFYYSNKGNHVIIIDLLVKNFSVN